MKSLLERLIIAVLRCKFTLLEFEKELSKTKREVLPLCKFTLLEFEKSGHGVGKSTSLGVNFFH
nr:hypothetical protein [uncultured Campylobacter sp.]